jgi:hypothetical protein
MESFANNTVPSGTISNPRLSSLNQTTWTNAIGGAPPAPQGMTFYKGVVAWRITANPTATRELAPILSLTNPWQIYLQVVRGSAPLYGLDEYMCWRVAMYAAYDNPTGVVTGDLGLQLGVGGNVCPRACTQAGLIFGPVNTGQIGVFVRQADAGAVTFNAPLAAAFQPADMTDWHLYEMRFTGADVNREATLRFMIDGVTTLTLSWGAGTVLPIPPNSGNQLGFHPLIRLGAPLAAGNYGMWLATPGGFMVSAGPTEESLL